METTLTEEAPYATPQTSLYRSILYGDWGFDGRMRVIPDKFEIFEFEVEDVFDSGIHFHLGKGFRFAGKLEIHLVHVIGINMCVAEGVDEVAEF